MVALVDYRSHRVGDWRLKTLRHRWTPQLQNRVLELACGQIAARHPQTLSLCCEIGSDEKFFFLKIFHRGRGLIGLKDLLRQSRATRFWRQGLALSAAGFKVPLTIAVGAQGGWAIARRMFVLTEKIDGVPAPMYLGKSFAGDRSKLAFKRDSLTELAKLLRQFHRIGFVHGDLVASNILVAASLGGGVEFYLMDNDRTRKYPIWMPQSLWKRNLIQLNRMPLPGVSLQDRMRFLHAYLNIRRLSHRERQFARWLEAKTRQRRKECDGVRL